jgi:protein-tyrosine phosphatase
MNEPFRILTVCTGNVCRSPMVERLLRAGLRERFGAQADDVLVASAGTGALVGEPMTPQTAALVTRLGGNPDRHVARMLEQQMVLDADLVLTLTRQHRSAVAMLVPQATRTTFTLREMARLAPLVEPGELPDALLADRLRALVPAVAARRGFVPVEDPRDDDVLDPYRRSDKVYAQMSDQVVPAVRALVAAVAR